MVDEPPHRSSSGLLVRIQSPPHGVLAQLGPSVRLESLRKPFEHDRMPATYTSIYGVPKLWLTSLTAVRGADSAMMIELLIVAISFQDWAQYNFRPVKSIDQAGSRKKMIAVVKVDI